MRAISLAAALAVAALVCGGCADDSSASSRSTYAVAADDAWVGPELFNFALVERSERELGLAELRGAPFVFDFIFTQCSGPCPRMSAQMRKLQDELAGTSVRLVSFSVDPQHDTPQVLAGYAQLFGADAQRWLFLTGEEAQIDRLAASVQLARARDADAPAGERVSHSTKLLVADGRGRVRGYYEGENEDGRQAAAARARWLAAHPER
jgi:cytochrome oxidase Cu insertion factor (SCO1/SenC/PrrC family)